MIVYFFTLHTTLNVQCGTLIAVTPVCVGFSFVNESRHRLRISRNSAAYAFDLNTSHEMLKLVLLMFFMISQFASNLNNDQFSPRKNEIRTVQ